MFDLEQAIAEWRRKMTAAGIKTPTLLEELESHLRDEVDRRAQSGGDLNLAFCGAMEQLGQPRALKTEFAKLIATNDIVARIKDFFLTLAGIPNVSLATNMNTSSPNTNIQPAWATYLKSGACILPALTVWWIVVLFVFPKLNQMCHHAGVEIPAVYYLALSLTQHGLLVGGGIVAAFILLEWRSGRWPRYRRATVGTGVFVINSAILVLIAAMVVLATIAAANLANHMK